MSEEVAETERAMRAVEVDMDCSCGGKMRPDGAVLFSMPPQFPHRCNKCGHSKNLRASYPYIKHVPLDGIPIHPTSLTHKGETAIAKKPDATGVFDES